MNTMAERNVQFGYTATVRVPRWTTFIETVQATEAAGFSHVATGDSHTMHRDMFVMLGLAANATSTIRLGTSVTNPSSRHAATIANAIATVDDVSGGRAFLGIGSGDNAVLNLGLRRATTAELGEAIVAIRELSGGRDVDFRGQALKNRWAHRSVPIIMSAEGPRALRLAGGVADGVLLGTGISDESIDWALAEVAEGALAIGRSIEDLEVWVLVRWAISDDPAVVRAQLGSLMASAGHHALRGDAAAKGVPAELIPLVHELDERYDPSHHVVRGESPNAVLVRDLGLMDYLLDRFAIVGTGEECTAQVRRLAERGITNLFLTTANTGDPVAEVRTWSKEVISRLDVPSSASATDAPTDRRPGTGEADR
jgi:5,10-methylenetetrahydromethanopterin reductase